MNVELDPHDKKRLLALARESGKEIDELLRELVHEALETRTDVVEVAPDERQAAWQSFLVAGAEWSKELPAGHIVDDSRESIYSGRGE